MSKSDEKDGEAGSFLPPPIHCYIVHEEYELGDEVCMNGYIHYCASKISTIGASSIGEWKKKSPSKYNKPPHK